MRAIVTFFLFRSVVCDDFVRKPIYKYRYETEDVMKSSASGDPVRGYQVVEGGFYAPENGYRSFGDHGFLPEIKSPGLGEYMDVDFAATGIGSPELGNTFLPTGIDYYNPIGHMGLDGKFF